MCVCSKLHGLGAYGLAKRLGGSTDQWHSNWPRYCEREGIRHSKEDSRSLRMQRLEELEDSIVGTEIDAYIIQPGVLERLIKTSQ